MRDRSRIAVFNWPLTQRHNITCPPSLYFSNILNKSCPQEVSNLPYVVCSIYRYESINVSADDAYIPMKRGIPARNFTGKCHIVLASTRMFNCTADKID